MAITALTDARIWLDKYDLVDDTNEVAVDWEAEELDKTTFGSSGKREKTGGIETFTLNVKGFLNFAASQSDEALASIIGQTDKVVSVAAAAAEGSTALLAKAMTPKLSRGAKIGQLSMFDGSLTGSAAPGLVEGIVAAPKTTLSGTVISGTTGVQHGAISASQVGYAALHVFSVGGGGSLLVKMQSDDNPSFTSGTDRITFTTTGTPTSEWQTVGGAITDDYWRVTWALDTGSAVFAVTFGIA